MKKVLLAAAMLALPLAANADIVTFDFSGIVTGAVSNDTSLQIADGTVVTGTYTFNLANTSGVGTYGTPGSYQDPWQSESSGGGTSQFPLPTALVFTSTAQIATKDGLISYATTPGSYSSQSIVQGVSASQLFVSEAQQGPLNLNYSLSGSEIDIDNPNGAPVFAPTTSTLAGTPVVNVDGTLNGIYNGQFTNAQGLFEYQITSLTLASDIPSPVPLPASAWLLVAGLGGLGVLARKRRAAFSAS